MPAQLVVVTRDRARGLALVTGGAGAARAARMAAHVERPARWSPTARGWVLDDPYGVLQLRGWCQLHGLWLRERELTT